jgi:hypothetical protein
MTGEPSGRDLTKGAVWKGLIALAVLVGLILLMLVAIVSFLPKLAPGL